MPTEMHMSLAQHPVKDTKGNAYTDFDSDFVVEISKEVTPSVDGLFHFHRHSKTKRTVFHKSLDGDSRIHHRLYPHEISLIQKKHAESGQHFNTDYSILAYPDARFVRSLKDISKHVDKKYRPHLYSFIQKVIVEQEPRLISGTLHTLLSYNKSGFGATPTFEINEDGYQIDTDYDEPLDFILDSKGKIIGKDPYYISDLDPRPTLRRPSTIETSIKKVDINGKKFGIFVGMEIRGTFDDIVNTFRSTDLGKKIKDNNDEFPEWPKIVTPFLTIRPIEL